MNTFTVIFLCALFLSFSVQFWLSRRQITHVLANRGEVPEAFRESITLEAHQKAADYTVDKNRVGHIDAIVGLGVVLLLTLGGGIDLIFGLWTDLELSDIMKGVGAIISVMLVMHVIELPLGIYKTFVIEERYGFNRNTPRQFAIDQALQLGLMLAIGAPLLALILWIMDSVGSLWWLLAWSILIGFSLLMSWAYPTVIAPLFNKFTPLSDATLKERIENLLSRCGFSSKGIYVMDGSRRSGHGNAYFTGIGSHKRIVFFDTLVETLEHEELEAVLAHELGHFKRKHVIKMLAATSLLSLVSLGVLGWLIDKSWFYAGLGVTEPSNSAALLLFILISPAFTVFLQPISTYFQRKHEFEADDFASAFAKPAKLISALVKLYRDNASTLTPDPLYSAFHYSHPPAAIRIANLAEKSTATSP